MAFGDTVQSVQASDSAVGSLAVTFSAATAGNLLIACFSRSATVTFGTNPTDWLTVNGITDAAGNMGCKWYYKYAVGGETSVTATTAITSGNFRGAVAEFEGPFEASPLDQSAESEANISTVVTSQPSGTTGTTSQNDELAIAVFGADNAANVDTSRTYSNSFTEVIFASAVSDTGRAMAAIAKLVLTATGTYSTTYSCTDTGDEMYGSIATFKKQAAGGSSIVPITLAQRRQRA